MRSLKNKRPNIWKREVNEKIEEKNKARLMEDCHKTVNGQKVRKTKTSHIVDHILADTYERKPIPEIQDLTKQETKTLAIARYKMLECGTNFKSSRSILCSTCKNTDDENHRLNHCVMYKNTNCYSRDEKVTFDDVYSTNTDVLKRVIKEIEKVWNTRNAHGTMM